MAEPSQYSTEMAKGSVWSLAGGTFYKLISFLYLVVVAHAVSQDELGLFFLAFNVVTVFSIIDDLGLPTALVRYVPFYEGKKEEAKIRPLLRATYLLVSASAVLLMAVLFLSADWIGAAYGNQALPGAIRTLSLFLLLSNIFKAANAFVQSRADIKSMQSEQNAQNFLRLALTVAFIYAFGPTFWSLAAGLLASYLLAIPLSLYDASHALKGLPSGGRIGLGTILREIAPFGIMLSVLQSLGAVVTATNSLLLGLLVPASVSAATVAVFSVATTIPYAILTFSSAVGSIFLPLLSRLHGRDERKEIGKVAETAQRWTVLTTIPPTIAMAAFSGELINLVSGSGYEAGAPAMALFSLALMVGSLSLTFSLAFSAMRRIRIQLWILAATGILNIALNLLLIPGYGMAGSAFASLASYALSTALLAYYSKRMMGISFPAQMARLAAASLLSFAAMFILRPYLLLAMPSMPEGYYAAKASLTIFLAAVLCISFALFLLCVLLFRCLKREDVVIMEKGMRKARLPPWLVGFSIRVASYGIS